MRFNTFNNLIASSLFILASCIPSGGPSGDRSGGGSSGGGGGGSVTPHNMLLVAGNLQSATVGTAVTVKPRIRIVSSSGVGISGVSIAFTVLSGGGSVGSPLVVTDVNGFAETTYTLGGTAGTNTMRASAPLITLPGTPTTITFTETGTVGAATKLGFAIQPSNTATAGVNLTTQPAVAVMDGFNNVITSNNSASITLAAFVDSSCTIAAGAGFSVTTNPVTATSGFSLFSGVNHTVAQNIYIQATSPGLTSACSSVVAVAPNSPNKIAFTTQPPATATAGSDFTTQPVTAIQDAYNNTITSDSTSQVLLEPFTDALCTVASLGTLSATTNPLTVSSGSATFTGTQHSKSETIYIKASSGAFSTCSSAVAVGAAPASKLVFTTQPPVSGTAGVDLSTNPVVEVQDSLNNTVTTDNTTQVTLAVFTNALCTTPSTGTFSASNNPATATAGSVVFLNVNHEKAETIYLQASAPGLTPACSTAITVSPAAASKLVFSTQPSSPEVSDTVFGTQPSVEVQDTFGNLIVSDNSTNVTLSPFTNAICTAASTGTLSATTNPLTVVGGQSNFLGVKHSKAESLYILATAPGLTPACSNVVNITAGAATQLAFTTQPSNTATAGVNLGTQPVVEVQDASGNVVSTDNTTNITLSAFTDAGCTVSSSGTFNATTNPLTVSSGVAAFSGVNHEKAEVIYIKATAAGLTSECTTLVTVSPNSPNKIVFSTQPSTPEVADIAFGTQPVLQIQDIYNNTITSDSTSQVQLDPFTNASCTVASTGTLSATTNPLTVSAGVATFAGVKHSKSETLYIKATSGSFTACSTAVTIAAGAATKVVFSTEPSNTATAGSDFAQQPVVQIQDANNNVVVTDNTSQVTLAAFTDAACTVASTGTFSATTNPLTVSSGVGTFGGVQHNKAETIYIRATVGGLTSDCSTQVVVSPGAATKVVYSTQPASSVVAGVNLATPPVVQIQDASNNVVASDNTSQVTLAAFTDAACTVASTGTFSATTNPLTVSAGVATFSGVNHTKAETLYIKATSGALTSACSTLVTVSHAAASKVVFSTQPSSPEVADTVFGTQPVIQIQDTFNNLVTSDSSTNVTLSPYTNSICTAASTGTLSATTNPESASSGVVTFAGVKHSKAEALYIQASAGGLTPACSTVVNISAGSATKVVFSTNPSSTATAGSNFAQQPVVQVQDANNNVVVTDNTSQVTLAAFTDAACTVASTGTFSATTNPLTVSAGVATFAGVNHTKAESLYIRASSGALTTACSPLVTVSHAAASKVVFSTQPSTPEVADIVFGTQPIVQVRDTFDNVVLSDNASQVTLAAFTDVACTVASTGTFSATTNPLTVSAGVATFAGAKHSKAETIYLKATNGALTTDCSSAVVIGAGVATKVVFSTNPSSTATAGSNFAQQPVVQIQDANNNIVTSDNTSQVTLAAFTDAACTVASTGTFSATSNPLTVSAGVATFAGVQHNKAETIYIRASSGALTTACFAQTVISPGAATKVVFSTQPSSTATAGSNFAQQPIVQIQDASNNVVASDNASQVTLTAFTDAACTVASTGTFSATTNPLTVSAGVATFAGVNHTKAESLYIRASSGALTTACSPLVTVSPAAASKVVFSTQPSNSGTANTNLAQQPVVQVQDTYNNVIASDSSSQVTLAAFTNAACTVASTGTFSATTNPLSVSAGVATFAGVQHNKAETIYIRASSGALTTACSNNVVISAGAATKVVFSTNPSSTATAGTNFAQQPVVQIQDASNNVVASDNSSQVTLAAFTDAACTVASTGTFSATTNPLTVSAGVATFAGVNHTKAESLYIRASSGALTTACSPLVTVSPAAASKVVFSTQPSNSGTANTNLAQQPVVQVQDTYNNVIVSDSSSQVTLAAFTNAACTVASTGTFSATTNPLTVSAGVATFAGVQHNKAETIYIRASSGALTTACSNNVVISAGAATKVVFSTNPSSTATAGTNFAQQPVVQIQDASNNVVASDNASQVTLAAFTDAACTVASTSSILATTNPLTVSSGVATFAGVRHTKAESLYIRASSGALTTACSPLVTVSPAAASKVVFSTQPSNSGTAGVALTTQPTVQLQDAFNNIITSQNTGTVTLAAFTNATCTTAATGTFSATTNPVTYSSGSTTFAGVSYTKAENLYIRATSSVGSFTACSNAVVISAAAPDDASSTLTTNPATGVVANDTATSDITVSLFDQYGNPCAGVSVTVNSDGTGNTIVQPGTTNASGVAVGTIKSTKAETKVITITAPSGLTATDTVDFIAGPPSATTSTIEAIPNSGVSANGTTTAIVRITLLDAFSNPIEGQTTTFASTGTGNTLVQPAVVTDSNGQAEGTIASTVAETKTLSIATPAGFSLNTVTNTVVFIVSNVSAANSNITGTGPVIADGVATSTITISLRDTNNDPVAGITPLFNATNPGSGNSYASCSVSNASGISTCTMTSTAAGVKTLSITAPISDTGGTVTFTRDVETSIEMLDVGVTGNTTATTFGRSRTGLDTSYYDGTRTYTFEASCINTGGASATLSLIDSAGTSKVSLTIPSGTTSPTRFSNTFTPTVASGADNYRVQTGASSTALTCYTARIVVRQTGATKTRIFIPLIGSDYNSASNLDTSAAAVDSRVNNTAYTKTIPQRFSFFTYTAAEWGVLATVGWTFEAVVQTSGGTNGGRLRIYTTAGTSIATFGSSTTTMSLLTLNRNTLTTATSYELRHRSPSTSTSHFLYRAGLWANIANIQKGVSHYRVAKRNTLTTNTTITHARAQIDLSRFTNGSAYFEATGADSVAGTSNLDLQTLGTNDTGSSGSNIGSSSIDFTTTTMTRTRTGALSITNGDRFMPQATVTSGTQDTTQACVLVIWN